MTTVSQPFLAALAIPTLASLLASCTPMILDGPAPSLPAQPVVTGSANAPEGVVIVLPEEIYKTLPPGPTDVHIATEAQLGLIEDYAMRLSPGDRDLLESRVNDCRFTAHTSCVISPAPAEQPG